MRIVDLTHTITEDMPVYPGTERPTLRPASTYEADGFRETLLGMYSHTGTHMDAPAHIFPGGRRLDDYPAGHFVGGAVTVDCSSPAPGGLITMAHLAPQASRLERADFVLFRTGWDAFWKEDAYFRGYPCPDAEVMEYLAGAGKKGIGLDSISLDPVDMAHLPNHRRILGLDHTVIIENLANLDQTGSDLFSFYVLPLKFENSDGAPVRAIAVLE